MKKRKPIRKKRKAVSPIQIAMDVAEDSWKKAVARRDKYCQIHGPICEGVLQADHFRSRAHGWTFLDVRNGTLICAGMNQAKAMSWHNAAERITSIVIKREGQACVDYLLEMSRQPKKWTLMELENITHELNGMWI